MIIFLWSDSLHLVYFNLFHIKAFMILHRTDERLKIVLYLGAYLAFFWIQKRRVLRYCVNVIMCCDTGLLHFTTRPAANSFYSTATDISKHFNWSVRLIISKLANSLGHFRFFFVPKWQNYYSSFILGVDLRQRKRDWKKREL